MSNLCLIKHDNGNKAKLCQYKKLYKTEPWNNGVIYWYLCNIKPFYVKKIKIF